MQPVRQATKHRQDLEERTYLFAERVRKFVGLVPATLANTEYARQLVRSSGSVAANYIEAVESLGAKDFLLKMKTCRKEAKETRLWLRLIDVKGSATLEAERSYLLEEAREFLLMFSTIVRNVSCKPQTLKPGS